ncbi:MAG: hypothetical protein HZB23_11330 [Deltaproteobacteria bacterium]|nr:hypothetical protein [Deltaproteobacteria bacterium]
MSQIDPQKPVVTPFIGPNDPRLGPEAVLVSVEPDLTGLAKKAGLGGKPWRNGPFCRVYVKSHKKGGPCAAGPVMGAPQAAAALEMLIAWGVTDVVFAGWYFGASDEGTSLHYGLDSSGISRPSATGRERLCGLLSDAGVSYASGGVWTCDALFRETPEKIERFAQKGAVVVDMETAALFSVAAFHKIRLSAVLTVSDELFGHHWRAGFLDRPFGESRRKISEALCPIFSK